MDTGRSRPVTIRLSSELYENASVIAEVGGTSLRDMVESGLRSEVDARLRTGGDELERAIAAVRTYREKVMPQM